MLATFQALKAAIEANELSDFLIETVDAYIGSDKYKNMLDAYEVYCGRNPFAEERMSKIMLDTGRNIEFKPAVYKKNNFFARIVDRLINRLQYNPVQFDAKEHMGDGFDSVLKRASIFAAMHGESYIFWNHDHIEHFVAADKGRGYIPLVDERTGAHKAGVRFWRLGDDDSKPMYIQLYEMDGMTEWVEIEGELKPSPENPAKTPYQRVITQSGVGIHAVQGMNYPDFPVVPLYVNHRHESELTEPVRTGINLHDAVSTSFADSFLKSHPLYWLFSGTSMNADELLALKQNIDATGIIADSLGNATIDAKAVSLPYEAWERLLDQLERSVFIDAQIVNLNTLISGGVTATAIRAAMDDEDAKVRGMEEQVRTFIQRLCAIAGHKAGEIMLIHRAPLNELEIMQMLKHAHDMGVPTEALIPLMPMLQGRVEETMALFEQHGLGFFEEPAEPLGDGQTD